MVLTSDINHSDYNINLRLMMDKLRENRDIDDLTDVLEESMYLCRSMNLKKAAVFESY